MLTMTHMSSARSEQQNAMFLDAEYIQYNSSLPQTPLVLKMKTEESLLSVVDVLGRDTVLASLDAGLSVIFSRARERVNSLLPGPCLESDRRDIDESRSSSWLETTHFVHGGKLGIVQTLVRVSTLDNDVTLVQLQSNETVDSLLRSWDSGSDEFPFWREKESIVENLREFSSNELISHSSDVSVERHSLQIHVCDSENGGCRRLVTSSRFDSNESVLDNIDSSNTVLSSEGVEGQKDLDRVGDALAVGGGGDLDGQTLEPFNVDLFRLLGRVLGRSGQLPHVVGRSLVGVFENTSLVGNVEEVLVGRPGLRGSLDNGDTVASSVLEEGGSTSESVVEFCESAQFAHLLEVTYQGVAKEQ
jgi:hypothetical protein